MDIANEFFLIFLTTILFVRVILFLKPISSPTIGGFRIHHYMYGLIIIVAGFITGSISLYAICMGLFIDELAYLIIRGKTHEDNYSGKSLLGTFLFILIIFMLKAYLVRFFM